MIKKLVGGISFVLISVLLLSSFGTLTALAAPFFGSITPNSGPDTGGTNVTITGSSFRDYTETPITIPNTTGSTITSQGFHFRRDTTGIANCTDDINFYDDDSSTLTVIMNGGCGRKETMYVVQVPNIPPGGKTITMRTGATVSGFSYIAPGTINYPNYREWIDFNTANNEATHWGLDVEGDSDGNIYVLYGRQAAPISSINIYTLVKLDPTTGNRIWTRQMQRTFVGTGGHQIRMQKFRIDDNDNIVIIGRFFQNGIFEFEDTVGVQTLDNQTGFQPGFVAIYDKDGNISNLTTNIFNSSSSDIDEVELDSAGNIYVSSYLAPNTNIQKYNPTGDTFQWVQNVPGGSSDRESFIVHSDGFIYTVGEREIQKRSTVDGSLVWSKIYGGSTNYNFAGISENPDGTILVNANPVSSGPYTASVDAISETSTVPVGINDSFLTTIDQSGVVQDITFTGISMGSAQFASWGHNRDNAGNVYSIDGNKFSIDGEYLGRTHGYANRQTDSWFDADDSFVTTIGGTVDTRGLEVEEIDTGALDTDRYNYAVRFPLNPPAQGASQTTQTEVELDGLACTNINIVSGFELNCDTPAHSPGVVDVVLENPGETISPTSTGSNAYTYNFSGTTIAPSNYGASNCSPDPATIGVDTVTCLIELTGDTNDNYGLPGSGITGNLDGLSSGDPCTIINNGTASAQLSCTNIPTTGGTPGSVDVQTNDTSTTTNIDNITLQSPVADTDNDGVDDTQESTDGTDPNDPNDYQDSDGDTVPDEVESNQGTDPFDPGDFLDDDNGGLPNYVEDVLIPNNGGSPLNNADSGDDSDPDNDGIPASQEQLAFNSGDGNGDGIQDFIQPDVTTINNQDLDSYVTMQSTVCTDIDSLEFIQESDNSIEDEDFDYPYGLHRFDVECITPGSTATITFYWGDNLDTSNWVYRKFDNSSYFGFDGVTIGETTINNQTITTSAMTVTDGGPYDVDGVANGRIIDPAGPTLPIITGNTNLDNLIRTGGSLTSSINNNQAAMGLLLIATGIGLSTAYHYKKKI